MSRPGVPNPSEAVCTLNHHLRALSSRIAGATRSGPTSALPRPFPGVARRAWKNSERGSHGRDAHRSAESRARWGGDPRLGSFPDPGGAKRRGEMGGAGRIPGALGRTGRQEVPWVHCPGDASHSGSNAWVGMGGLGLGPSRPQTEGSPSPPPSSRGGGSGPRSSRPSAVRRGAGARCSLVRTRHLRHPHPQLSTLLSVRPGPGTSGCLLADLASTCPDRRAWAWRPALPPPPPSSRAALFPVQQYSEGGTSRERPSELPPGLGLGCGCERQSPVSWLPVPSGPGQRPRSRDATLSPSTSRDPGPHLVVSRRWRQQGQDGGGRGEGASSPTSGQTSLPLLGSVPPAHLNILAGLKILTLSGYLSFFSCKGDSNTYFTVDC